jgi:hypothetical protein
MFQDQNLLPAADYGRLAFDHFLLVQQFSPLLKPRGVHFSRGVVGSTYLQLGSKEREVGLIHAPLLLFLFLYAEMLILGLCDRSTIRKQPHVIYL